MALKPYYTSETEVPEDHKALYVKSDDGDRYQLDVEGGIPDVTKLKSALESERTAAKDLRGQLSRFNGFDPDEFHTLQGMKAEYEAAIGQGDERIEKLKSELETKYSQQLTHRDSQLKLKDEEIAKRDERLARAEGREANNFLEAEAAKAFTDLEGSGELLIPHVKLRAKAVMVGEGENARMVTRVFDADGNERVNGSDGNPMTVADLVREMKNQPAFAPAFRSSSRTGNGTGQGRRGRPPGSGKKKSDMNYQEKADYMKQYGSEAYRNLPA